MRERNFGSFERSFEMPEGIDADKIEASFKNGVLTHIIILLLLLFFFLLFALDDQVAIGNLHFDVLLVHPG